jgi:hypothetical protein
MVLGNGTINVGIGVSSPNATAILDLTSDSLGLLIPRLTTTQRNGILSPAAGLQVYDKTLNSLYIYNGSSWSSLSAGSIYSAGAGITITGTTIKADSNNAVWNANKLQGANISTTAPANKQVLKWNSTTSQWTPSVDSNTIYTGSKGVLVTGTTISGSYTGSNGVSVSGSVISGNYTAGAGISITGSTIKADSNKAVWNANKLQGANISTSAPANKQVLKWNSTTSQWIPSTDSNTIYTGSNGVLVVGTTISGNYTGSNGILISGSTIKGNYIAGAGITISGSTIKADSNNAVWNANKLQGKTISSAAPANKQVLKWSTSTSQWAPSTDSTTAYTGSNGVSVSGSIITGNYSGGTGISISGSTINSVWATNGANLYNNTIGYVGIGKLAPAHGLDVKNAINTDSAYFISGTKILSANAGGNFNGGRAAGMSNTGGAHNTFVGDSADAIYNNLVNAMAIGYNARVAKSNSIVLGNNNTQVGIGSVIAPAYSLQMANNSAAKPGSATWTIASDSRLKKNIKPYVDGLEVLKNINPVWFEYTGEAGMPKGQQFVGVLAQDVKKIAPYMVGTWQYQDKNGNKKDYLDYDANSLFYILVNSVKEQQKHLTAKDAEIANQKTDIALLQSQMDEQKKDISILKQMMTDMMQCTGCSTPTPAIESNLMSNISASLDQNIPNPFSRSTMIGYFIPANVKSASIFISTLQGVQIVSYKIETNGKGQLILSSGVLAAGEYIYTLITDGAKADSKKMIIVKD